MHKKTVIDFKELGQRYIFTQPIKELKTRKPSQIQPILDQVDCYQKAGYYVVGYLSYEAGAAFEEKFQVHQGPLTAEYLAYFTVHLEAQVTEIPLSYEPVYLAEDWQSTISAQAYEAAIAKIHQEIRQGNTYQVNYTLQLSEQVEGDYWALYNRLVVEQNAAYNAYIEHDDFAVLSISPELFFKTQDQQLITRPMKGTVARGLRTKEDLELADWLAQDSKNRAENMMIVDLLRNDMNRICRLGSVQVQKLCQVEQYSTVWQMTSTIRGEIEADCKLRQIFQALFPCGSITGAPKISTMAIIKQLEPQARGLYCGTIGLCLPSGERIFNVAIRTLQIHQNQAIYGAGGGITWDSNWQSEYQEAQQKAAVLYRTNPQFQLFTTGKVSQGQLSFYQQHLKRLEEAARYFAFPFDQKKLEEELKELLKSVQDKENQRLKISLDKKGDFQFELAPLKALSKTFQQARLVQQKKELASPFTYFKTSHRPHLSLGEQEQIYYNSQGQLLETSIGNLILKLDGKLYTPPVELGLLDGIYRQSLLQKGQVQEKILQLEDLAQAEQVYACNAVRGLYQLELAEQV
ncbi:aminodeoxychorismate synthase component I [Streptococcus oricebi]|uniref:Aminodeoxychorismate synthase, component I n=1 Tax=Streptococcus oricebi TaxID=1547447 RepID=A0ABS5B4X5_9STRE|nr:aminodeoxychorismate synthase component I [Streptococcus oricebi]MBP2623888.1 aminodeoxychorismate synthase, component I [Streptococcus oricebi]